MNVEFLGCVFASILFICCYIRYWNIFKHVKNLPGPKPNKIFGNTLDLMTTTDKLYVTLLEYVKQYGGIVKIHTGPLNLTVLITDYKLLEYILNSTKLIEKSDQYESFHRWLGKGLLTSAGTKWKNHRKLLTPTFHFSILTQFIEIFDSVGDIFIKRLQEEVGKPSFNIYPLVSLCTLDIICEAVMGTKINAQLDGKSEYVRSVKTMCAILISRATSPLHKYLYPFTINYYKEARALKVLHSFTDMIIDKRIKSPSDGIVENGDPIKPKRKLAFLDLLLQSNVDGVPLSRIELREEVDTFMFEGHDTTSSAITFALYSLAVNPHIQQKVLAEQKSIFEDRKDPKVSLSDLQNMKYLELVIKETLRLYPSVPLFGRMVSEEFEWEGTVFPKNLNLMIFPVGIHMNPEYFPEPEKFIPERFREWSGKNPYSYIPFSAGPRNCIGQKFAMLEMKSTISKVIRNYELCPTEPKHLLQLALETILVSRNGVCISLKRRNRL